MEIFTATNENYRMLLAALLASIVSNNRHQLDQLRLTVLDVGIEAATRKRLTTWAAEVGLNLRFETVDEALFFRHLGDDAFLPPKFPFYGRIFTPYMTDEATSHFLYLDTDIINTRPIPPLESIELGDSILGAVVDRGFQRFDSYGIVNYQEIGLPGDSPYFNSGVLLIDRTAWLEQNASRKIIDIVQHCPEDTKIKDQYAFNVFFHGKWRNLGDDWNQIEHTEADKTIFRHFPSQKPHVHQDQPITDQELFFQYVDESAWPGWRPSKLLAKARQDVQMIRGLLGKVKRSVQSK